ncbi:Uncharacterised protein [Vibrio cholerae]|nr:Uncharacterised protein [Vibrio cholerae]CSI67577.1 Uncharacterised protein [Vibrio cholerae]
MPQSKRCDLTLHLQQSQHSVQYRVQEKELNPAPEPL